MPIVLARIDDRLIHGQVVIGWGNYLKANRIILCSDSIATTPWLIEIFKSAGALAPSEMSISIWTEEETIKYFRDDSSQKERTILLVETPQELLNLVAQGAPIEVVNIGGMHYKQGKRQLAQYIFVDENDINSLNILKSRNIVLEGQDVPTSKKINVANLIDVT